MEELAVRVRTFVYTMICFQCLVQLSAGNAFHKYLKLFSQLISLCILCNIFFSFCGLVDGGWEQADRIYEQWKRQWEMETASKEADGYLENQIVEKAVYEFELQLDGLLKEVGKGEYELVRVTQQDKGWEIEIEGKHRMEQTKDEFAEVFRSKVCEEFSLTREQLEVKLR